MLFPQLKSYFLTCTIGKTHRRILAGIITGIFIRIGNVSIKTGLTTTPYTSAETGIILILLHESGSHRTSTPAAGNAYARSIPVTWSQIDRERITITITVIVMSSIHLQVEHYFP